MRGLGPNLNGRTQSLPGASASPGPSSTTCGCLRVGGRSQPHGLRDLNKCFLHFPSANRPHWQRDGAHLGQDMRPAIPPCPVAGPTRKEPSKNFSQRSAVRKRRQQGHNALDVKPCPGGVAASLHRTRRARTPHMPRGENAVHLPPASRSVG